MRTILLTALAAVALLSGGLFGNTAAAFVLGGAPTPGTATVASDVQRVHTICGANGCSMIQTKKVRHYNKPGSITGPGQRI
jgi:hypothetical protein